ncbi:hypothetical protein [Actinoplanes philippinensis]|uniref:hypothetical protein n=1 Tax=Actinoplanes philippinensis TaxID=35752 RepID=UPI0033CBA508
MTDSPDGAPATEDRFWPLMGAATATLGLVLLACCSGTLWPGMHGQCAGHETVRQCTPAILRVAKWSPAWGTGIGLAVTGVGCWIWPRRDLALWVTLGYLAALLGFGIAMAAG